MYGFCDGCDRSRKVREVPAGRNADPHRELVHFEPEGILTRASHDPREDKTPKPSSPHPRSDRGGGAGA
jgi:hypothetical protein